MRNRKDEEKEQERDKESESEKGGGQERLKRNKGRHRKINKNALSWEGKQGLFSIRSREEGKERKTQRKTNILTLLQFYQTHKNKPR